MDFEIKVFNYLDLKQINMILFKEEAEILKSVLTSIFNNLPPFAITAQS